MKSVFQALIVSQERFTGQVWTDSARGDFVKGEAWRGEAEGREERRGEKIKVNRLDKRKGGKESEI